MSNPLSSEALSLVARLRRPRLLIRAARHGVHEYDRNRDLKRLLRAQAVPAPERAVTALLAEEGEIEEKRVSGNRSYSLARHIEVLIAMMAEARLVTMQVQRG